MIRGKMVIETISGVRKNPLSAVVIKQTIVMDVEWRIYELDKKSYSPQNRPSLFNV